MIFLSTKEDKKCGENPFKSLEDIEQKSLFCIVIKAEKKGELIYVSLKENFDYIKSIYPAAPEVEYTALLIEESMLLHPTKTLIRIDYSNYDKMLILE
jgi:uncharacterized protein YcgL (UPF0745 family)